MNVSEARLRKVTQRILLEMLKDGIIPTAPKLLSAQRDVLGDRDSSQPLSNQPRESIGYREAASASKLNRMFDHAIDDLDVLYDSLLSSERGLEESFDRTLAELRRLDRLTKSLIGRVNRLLLTEKNTEGFLLTVGDDFVDTSKIDETRTTAFIDLAGQAVHGNYQFDGPAPVTNPIDLRRLTDRDITVTTLTPRSIGQPGIRGNLQNMLTDSTEYWTYSCQLQNPGPQRPPMSIEVKIDFRNMAQPVGTVLHIGKIVFDPVITNNSILTLIQYSVDGVTWFDLPVENPTRRLNGPSIYTFGGVDLNLLRIVMTKELPDGNNIYQFGIRHLGVFGLDGAYLNECELVSEMLYLLDADGNYEQFRQASLSLACEDRPGETDIEYSIAFKIPDGLGGHTESEFFVVGPVDRNDRLKPLVVSVSDITETESTETIDTVDSFMNDRNENNRVLTGVAPTNSYQVWRNLGSKERLYLVRTPSGATIEAGWNYDGFSYSCYGYIADPNGKDMNFGPTKIEIDGAIRTGLVHLEQGFHFFKTAERNWVSLLGLTSVTSFDPVTLAFEGTQTSVGATGIEDTLADPLTVTAGYGVIDPLYPYNHKLIIEGLDYNENFDDQITRNRYSGVDRFAGWLMLPIPRAEFDNTAQDTSYGVFCTVTAEDALVRTDRICVKWIEPVAGEDPREEFMVVEKTPSNSEDAFAEGVVFKAKFMTSNPSKTASLDGYQIRISK